MLKINDLHAQIHGDGYDIAQVCLNGHVVNDSMRASPESNAKFCEDCGGSTISECGSCKTPIRGKYNSAGLGFAYEFLAPAFCSNCGNAYPWTEAKMNAARDLISLSDLDDADKEALTTDLPDLAQDTPRTKVAATRFKKLVAKLGGGVASAVRDIVVDVASEAAKKTIFGS
jgi:hypothetical protein